VQSDFLNFLYKVLVTKSFHQIANLSEKYVDQNLGISI